MEEVTIQIDNTSYKIIKIENSLYELKKIRRNGKYYRISRFNCPNLLKAIEYSFKYKM